MTRPDKDQGFALLIVVWFLVLIGTISTYLLVNGRAETAIAHNIRAAASAEALADAGIARAAFNQADPEISRRWPLDGKAHLVTLPGGEISIRLEDENRKINPNLASDVLLAALLQACGLEHGVARRLGAAMADWVSPDGPARELGAKLEQYLAAGRRYGPPNAPLETLDDLNLVLGMTPAIFASIRPYLSIHTEADLPDLRNAPPTIRRAVALASIQKRANEEDGDEPDGSEPTPALQKLRPQDAKTETEPERLIDVQVTARGRDGGVFVRYAVLRLEADNPRGYTVLEWQRGELPEGISGW